jgi:hypothetical protein
MQMKKFYVVSYEENGKTIYYTDKKDTDLFDYETSDIFEAKRYLTYRKAENYVNNKKKEVVSRGLTKSIKNFKIHEVEVTYNETKETKL